jgi:hypothetical protein
MDKIFFFILALCSPTLAWCQPSIEFVTERHDFGQVVRGEQLEYSFKFTNKGTDELVVISLATS